MEMPLNIETLLKVTEQVCLDQNLIYSSAEVQVAIDYLARKKRWTHPDGSFDGGGRFYLSKDEQRSCCMGIRGPSRAHPHSEMVHGRTIAHVAALHGVEALDVRRLARRIEAKAFPHS